MFERFTEPAREVVVEAQHEARRLRHATIEAAHIALGLLRVRDGIASVVLTELGVDKETIRARLPSPGYAVPTGQIPFTSSAKRVMELALREALSLGHNYIGPEHILLGLVRSESSDIVGVPAERVRETVVQKLSRPGGPPTAALDFPDVWDAVDDVKERLIAHGQYDAAARLRNEERRLQRILNGVEAMPARWEYEVKTLDGTSDTWVARLEEWRRDGWKLISAVPEGGAIRAILERRRRQT